MCVPFLGAAKKDTKIKKLVIKRTPLALPTQEDFNLVTRAVACAEHVLKEYDLEKDSESDMSMSCSISNFEINQTKQGLFLHVYHSSGLGLWTRFGAVHVLHGYCANYEKVAQVAEVLKARFYVGTAQKITSGEIFPITKIDEQNVPEAQTAGPSCCLKEDELSLLWNTFSVAQAEERKKLLEEKKQREKEEMKKDAEWQMVSKPCEKKGLLQLYGFRPWRLLW
jgi:hypothetical protein